MEIKIVEGCTAYCTFVEGKAVHEMQPWEVDAVIDFLLPRVKRGINDNTISLNRLIELFQYDTSVDDKIDCECCGDTVTTTTWKFED